MKAIGLQYFVSQYFHICAQIFSYCVTYTAGILEKATWQPYLQAQINEKKMQHTTTHRPTVKVRPNKRKHTTFMIPVSKAITAFWKACVFGAWEHLKG